MVIYMLLHTLDKLEKHSPVVKSVHFRINNPDLNLDRCSSALFSLFFKQFFAQGKIWTSLIKSPAPPLSIWITYTNIFQTHFMNIYWIYYYYYHTLLLIRRWYVTYILKEKIHKVAYLSIKLQKITTLLSNYIL